MRIAVYGTGGAGGYFGSQLALAGEDIILIAAAGTSTQFEAMVCGWRARPGKQ